MQNLLSEEVTILMGSLPLAIVKGDVSGVVKI